MSKKKIITDVAAKLFSEQGFKDTSMADLSRLSGAAEGTIFYHFRTKEDILLAILENIRERIIEEFERYNKEKRFETGLEMMEGVISFYFDLAGKMEHSFLLLHHHYLYKLAEVNPVCREHLEAIYNCLADIFEIAILKGQADGSIAQMSAKKTALILFSMVDGLVRFKTYKLYDAGALYAPMLAACRKILTPNT